MQARLQQQQTLTVKKSLARAVSLHQEQQLQVPTQCHPEAVRLRPTETANDDGEDTCLVKEDAETRVHQEEVVVTAAAAGEVLLHPITVINQVIIIIIQVIIVVVLDDGNEDTINMHHLQEIDIIWSEEVTIIVEEDHLHLAGTTIPSTASMPLLLVPPEVQVPEDITIEIEIEAVIVDAAVTVTVAVEVDPVLPVAAPVGPPRDPRVGVSVDPIPDLGHDLDPHPHDPETVPLDEGLAIGDVQVGLIVPTLHPHPGRLLLLPRKSLWKTIPLAMTIVYSPRIKGLSLSLS